MKSADPLGSRLKELDQSLHVSPSSLNAAQLTQDVVARKRQRRQYRNGLFVATAAAAGLALLGFFFVESQPDARGVARNLAATILHTETETQNQPAVQTTRAPRLTRQQLLQSMEQNKRLLLALEHQMARQNELMRNRQTRLKQLAHLTQTREYYRIRDQVSHQVEPEMIDLNF